MERFEVEVILDEKRVGKSRYFLVQWEGYAPDWEAWRISGNVGEPVTSWEPERNLHCTRALHSWRNRVA